MLMQPMDTASKTSYRYQPVKRSFFFWPKKEAFFSIFFFPKKGTIDIMHSIINLSCIKKFFPTKLELRLYLQKRRGSRKVLQIPQPYGLPSLLCLSYVYFLSKLLSQSQNPKVLPACYRNLPMQCLC